MGAQFEARTARNCANCAAKVSLDSAQFGCVTCFQQVSLNCAQLLQTENNPRSLRNALAQKPHRRTPTAVARLTRRYMRGVQSVGDLKGRQLCKMRAN